ncbi:MAG TPA: hypothetical protein VGF34_21065 [Stellaceae bacterium]|jgi:hypothetical protein
MNKMDHTPEPPNNPIRASRETQTPPPESAVKTKGPPSDACTWRGALKHAEEFALRGMQIPQRANPLTQAVTAIIATADGVLDAGLECVEHLTRPKPPVP